jgi:hypothetical protein
MKSKEVAHSNWKTRAGVVWIRCVDDDFAGELGPEGKKQRWRVREAARKCSEAARRALCRRERRGHKDDGSSSSACVLWGHTDQLGHVSRFEITRTTCVGGAYPPCQSLPNWRVHSLESPWFVLRLCLCIRQGIECRQRCAALFRSLEILTARDGLQLPKLRPCGCPGGQCREYRL